jgi:hypothetical protein
LPEPERERKRKKRQADDEKQARLGLAATIVVFGVAIFGVTLYLSYHMGIELSTDDMAEYVKRYGNWYLDLWHGDMKEEYWYYDKELQKYICVEEDVWTEDEIDSSDDDNPTVVDDESF